MKLQWLLLLVVFLSFGSNPTAAQTMSPTQLQNRIQERATQVQERTEAIVTNAQERVEERQQVRETVRENIQAVRNTTAETHANRLERRFALYAERLLQIAARIETKAQDSEIPPAVREQVLTLVNQARTSIASAQTRATESVAMFRSVETGEADVWRRMMLEARDMAEATRADFITAKTALKEALVLLVSTQVN